MAALPATVPIMLSSERRLGAGSVISGCPFAGLLSQRMTGLAMWPGTSGNRQWDQRHEFEAADGGTPAPFRLETPRGFEVRDIIDIKLEADFETKTTLGINNLLVSLDSEIRPEPD